MKGYPKCTSKSTRPIDGHRSERMQRIEQLDKTNRLHEAGRRPRLMMVIQAGKKVSIEALVLVGITDKVTAIESRVARIKARVAELTGNMDGARR